MGLIERERERWRMQRSMAEVADGLLRERLLLSLVEPKGWGESSLSLFVTHVCVFPVDECIYSAISFQFLVDT